MITGKRKCRSAPKPGEKRATTASSSINSVAGPIVPKRVMINQKVTTSPSIDEIKKSITILCGADDMPYATFKMAIEELKDDYTLFFFLGGRSEFRLEWLEKITPPKNKKSFVRWRKKFLFKNKSVS